MGAGLSGLAAAHELARSGGVRVTLYEEDHLSKTMAVDDGTGRVLIDLGCMVFNQVRTCMHAHCTVKTHEVLNL